MRGAVAAFAAEVAALHAACNAAWVCEWKGGSERERVRKAPAAQTEVAGDVQSAIVQSGGTCSLPEGEWWCVAPPYTHGVLKSSALHR